MEQRKTLRSEFIRLICLACLCVITLAGCKKPIENPESVDPIYSDLVAMGAGIRGKAEAQKKKIAELEAQIEKLEPRNPDKRRTIHEKQNLELGLLLMEQDATYYEIRAEQRRLYDKEAYMKAFKNDLPWPPDGEFQQYKEAKKLRNASRNWDDSVPKATQYNKVNPEKKKAKEEKKEEKKE